MMTQKPSRPTKKPPPEVIELDRSQETLPVPVRRAKHISNSSPAQHRPRQQTFKHNDSLQEVAGHEWQERNDLTRAEKASLEDERRRKQQFHDRDMQDVDDSQLLYSQSSHTVQGMQESEDMDIADDVIPETPETRRSSLCVDVDEMEWQTGTLLP